MPGRSPHRNTAAEDHVARQSKGIPANRVAAVGHGARDGAPRLHLAARQFDRKTIETKVRGHVGQWRTLLTKHVNDGRQLLREVLLGPLRFTPDGRAYRFEGEATFGPIIAGMVGVAPFGTSPAGFDRERTTFELQRNFRAA